MNIHSKKTDRAAQNSTPNQRSTSRSCFPLMPDVHLICNCYTTSVPTIPFGGTPLRVVIFINFLSLGEQPPKSFPHHLLPLHRHRHHQPHTTISANMIYLLCLPLSSNIVSALKTYGNQHVFPQQTKLATIIITTF